MVVKITIFFCLYTAILGCINWSKQLKILVFDVGYLLYDSELKYNFTKKIICKVIMKYLKIG